MSEIRRALVLGGGGVAGVAWETGILAALADGGVDVTTADRIIGTSAGSVVAAQITSGLPLSALLKRQTDPAQQTAELTSGVPMAELWAAMQEIYESTTDPAELRRRFGAMALSATTVDEAERRAVIAGRLPEHSWPDRDLVIVAVEALTGTPELFRPDSGVSLVDAVAASCAVPGVWPPVTIDGKRYIDGGMRSVTNADLAGGFDRVLVLAPVQNPIDPTEAVAGSVDVIGPDEASLAAFGLDVLSPASRTPSAEAGYTQGTTLIQRVADLWN